MRHRIAEDAKPQLMLLLIATVITLVLWFLPFADYLVYPIRLFVTFIHERPARVGEVIATEAGGHALLAAEVWVVEVRDSGPGPADEMTGRLYEPFVTGKADGVGLGLVVARQAVEAHGGWLDWRAAGLRVGGRLSRAGAEGDCGSGNGMAHRTGHCLQRGATPGNPGRTKDAGCWWAGKPQTGSFR